MSLKKVLKRGLKFAVSQSRRLQPARGDDEEGDDEVVEDGDDAEEEGDDDEEDEFVPSPFQVALVIFVIITFLIIVTILFELIKDYAIEESSKYMRPIILCLFSEMTVLVSSQFLLSLFAMVALLTSYQCGSLVILLLISLPSI